LLIEAARLLQGDPRIVIVICGNGEFRAEVEQAALGLDNVRFLDLRPAEALNELLNVAHVHLLPQRGGASDLVMPSKLTGMLASGRAVIASAMPGTEIARVVEGCGIRVEPESPEAFAQGLRALADDPALCERLGRAGRLYAERNLGAATLMRQLDVRLADLCATHGDGLMAPTDAVN
jgi:colanic acid biosynthesis glycosyl transferase WcaI